MSIFFKLMNEIYNSNIKTKKVACPLFFFSYF